MFGMAERKKFMNKKEIIEMLQEVLEFHNNVKRAHLSPNSSMILQELYGFDSNLLMTIFDFEGKSIEIYQLADWYCGNREYRMDIFINGIRQEKDIKFVKSILKKLQG